MGKNKTLILDKQQIEHRLQRMAYQLWETNSQEDSVTIIGIDGSGLVVAKSLATRLQKISPLKVSVIALKLNKKKPLAEEITISENLEGKSVVLVDDVTNSGKTLLFALRPLLNFELKRITVAVLVDRKHKSFPVSADIVGHSVATTLQEHIAVETEGDEITAAYLL